MPNSIPASPPPAYSNRNSIAISDIELGNINFRQSREHCTICLEALDQSIALNTITTLDCHHHFHSSCINNWRDHGRSIRNMRCPVCIEGNIPPGRLTSIRNWVNARKRSNNCIVATICGGSLIAIGCFILVGIVANLHRIQPAQNSSAST